MEGVTAQTECVICYQPMYGDRPPNFLGCGHIYCRQCTNNMKVDHVDFFTIECPECRTEHNFTGALPVIYQMGNLAELLHTVALAPKSCDHCHGQIIDGPHFCSVCYDAEVGKVKNLKRRYIFKNLTPYQRYLSNKRSGSCDFAQFVAKDVLLGPDEAPPTNAIILGPNATEPIAPNAQNDQPANNLNESSDVVPDSNPNSRAATLSPLSGLDDSFASDVRELLENPPIRVQSSPELGVRALVELMARDENLQNAENGVAGGVENGGDERVENGGDERYFVRARGQLPDAVGDDSVIHID